MRTVIRNSYTPQTGDYCNKIVVDQDKGVQYIFDSDGVWTTYTSKQQEGAPKFYVDSSINSAKNELKAYADEKDAIVLQEAKDYTDTHGGGGGTVTVDSALSDTSENPVQNRVITLALADKADASGLSTVATTGSYDDLSDKPTIPPAITVDSALSTTSTNPVQNGLITTALNSKANSSSLSTVATTGAYADLSGKPDVPVITLQTTDPGEGAALAENNFIGVYS